jgi:polyisoprenoid-binding protein YceI
MRRTRSLLVVGLVALAGLAQAASYTATGTPQVKFTGKGPAGFTLVGTTDKMELKDDGQQLTFDVPLDTVKTGIELRDRHMREKYLQTDKYPKATLVVLRSALRMPQANGQSTEGQASGKLTLHGVTRDVPVSYKVIRNGDVNQVTGVMKLNFRDFGVEVPSYMGITVKPDVVVDVAFGAKEA